ncbi:carbon-nitrogen hydrolase [Halteromyces radiatus]|uniref:carbon-nitrogen hydrolase n=1 Tax=Halteromyces radiatus TaxID=101107 RepID=UPI0022206AB8|nr:carbon-nitrogen hydrolase [Halteromyces radiatus]KAI8081291.1 carbon-nitrogen hydrolase [Halteromyces radiatus]
MSTIRVSVAQVSAYKFELEPTMTKLESYVKQAREQNSRLVVFPEAFIGRHPKHSTFGTVFEGSSPEYARYHKHAIAVPGPVTDRLVTLSKENDILLVVGVVERDKLTDTLYRSTVYIDPDEGYIGKHKKFIASSSDRAIWGEIADSSTLPANRDGHRISTVICWENYMPVLRTFMYSQGVQLYCEPTVDHRDIWQSNMQRIALEGQCFVFATCQFTRQKDYPEGHAGNDSDGGDPEAPHSLDGSVIISPLGTILAGPLRGDEGLLTADIDMEETT